MNIGVRFCIDLVCDAGFYLSPHWSIEEMINCHCYFVTIAVVPDLF